MRPENFQPVEDESTFAALLKEAGLFREDDVTFEDFGEAMFVYTGDDFSIDAALFESMEISSLLVKGSVTVDRLSVSEILGDLGVFAVTGNVHCKDMLYMTECTGVVIGGGLEISNAFYADCGNSVLQVGRDASARLFFNPQCTIDVHGDSRFELDEEASAEEVAALLGVDADADADVDEMIQAYFETQASGC